jgi:hypothetical protein
MVSLQAMMYLAPTPTLDVQHGTDTEGLWNMMILLLQT